MADGPALALQKALIARLRADAGIVALVAARVFDEPPQGVAFPYIRLGTFDVQALRMDCHTDTDIMFSIEAHSRPIAGRVQVTRIAEAIRTALDGADLTVTGFSVDWCQWMTHSVTRDADGKSYVATVAFQASLAVA